jgi:hypothetical protein
MALVRPPRHDEPPRRASLLDLAFLAMEAPTEAECLVRRRRQLAKYRTFGRKTHSLKPSPRATATTVAPIVPKAVSQSAVEVPPCSMTVTVVVAATSIS